MSRINNKKIRLKPLTIYDKEGPVLQKSRTFWLPVLGFRSKFDISKNVVWSEVILDGVEETLRIERLARKYDWTNQFTSFSNDD